jgi:hypothetical protein
MHRTVFAALLLLAACGVEVNDPNDDPRPRTLQYISTAILKPSCASATCHSSFRQESNRSFSTVEETCQTLAAGANGAPGDVKVGVPEESKLIEVMVRTVDRMPYDQPMPSVDRKLIEDWIATGAAGLPATKEECK